MNNQTELELFPLGRVVITLGIRVLGENGIAFGPYLERHRNGDWGDLCEQDKQMNNNALKHNNMLFSAYNLEGGGQIFIKTEWDRSVTTIMLPGED